MKGLKPPEPFIGKISQTGDLTILFSEDVLLLPDLSMIHNGTVTVYGITYPVLEIKIEPGEFSDDKRLKFDWIVVEQTPTSIRIQLYFNEAKFISANGDPEILMIMFRDPEMFRGVNTLLIKPDKRTLQRVLPGQLQVSEEGTAGIEAAVKNAEKGMATVVAANFVLTLLISASMNHLLSMINTQQIIVMMPLFKITLPANAGVFFNALMTFTAFDIIDTSPFLNWLLQLEPAQPVNSNFEAVGFESVFLLHNLGSLLLVFLYYLVVILVMKILECMGENEKAQKWAGNLRSDLFHGYMIRIMTESYSLLAVCCFINLGNL